MKLFRFKNYLLYLSLCLILSSCAYQLQSRDEQARALYFHDLGSILVVPFMNQTDHPEIGHLATEIFTSELARFQEVGVVHTETVNEYLKAQRIKIEQENIIDIAYQLGKVFDVEAVIIGAVTEYDPYFPPVLGLSLELISLRDQSTLLTFGETFDSNLNYVRVALKKYAGSREVSDSVYGREVALRKAESFVQFVSHEIIRKNL